MVLRVRIRSAKIFKDYTSYSRMSSHVILIGGGTKLRTVTAKEGGKQPVWEQSLTFPSNPPNVKLQIWVQHPNGDILAGEILMDLCNFYQREPYRIQPKKITLVHKNVPTAEIKVELDFDYDGMSAEQMKRIKAEGIKPQVQHKDLQIGTVVAVGRKALLKKQQEAERQMETGNDYQMPYQKPPTAPNQNNYQNDKDYYNKPSPWNNGQNPNNGNNVNKGNNGNNGWGNDWANNNNNERGNTNNNNNKGGNTKNSDNLLNFFGNIINKNQNTKKQPAKQNDNWGLNNDNKGWDDWKPPTADTRQKDDPWSKNNDPYGNNNGWDL